MLRSIIFTLTLMSVLFSMGVFARDVTFQNGVTATRGATSIVVNWTNTCKVCSWQLSAKGQGNNDPTISIVRPRGTTSYTITGLLPGQEYSINMAANRAGRWVNRALLTVTTLPIPPSGSWTPTDLNDQMSFTSYLASSSSELALAGLDNSLAPSATGRGSVEFFGFRSVENSVNQLIQFNF